MVGLRDRQAAVSLMPGVTGRGSGSLWNQMQVCIFESLQLEGSFLGT